MENHNYQKIILTFQDLGLWSIEFFKLSEDKQTLLTFCNSDMAPILHLTKDADELMLGYHDGKDWQHEKVKIALSTDYFLEFCFTLEEVFFYLNDEQLFVLSKELFKKINYVTVGVAPEMQGIKYFLLEDVRFDLQKAERVQKYLEATHYSGKYDEFIFNPEEDGHISLRLENVEKYYNQTFFIIGEKSDVIHSKVSLSLINGRLVLDYLENNKWLTYKLSLRDCWFWQENILLIDIYYDKHFIYFFINDNLIAFRRKEIIIGCNYFSVGIQERYIDGIYYLSEKILFSCKYSENNDLNQGVINNNDPDLSIILSVYADNYNHFLKTINCLYNLQKHTQSNYEIIFIDDGSTSEYLQIWLEDAIFFKNNVRFFTNSSNFGIARSRNLGGLKAQGKYLIFLDNDQTVLPDWDVKYINILEANVKCIVGEHKKHSKPFYASYAAEDENITELSYINGGGLALSKSNFIALGGFDEVFSPMYCEDSELSWRANGLGYDLIPLNLQDIIYHSNDSTIKKMPNSDNYLLVNNIKLIDKYKHKFDIATVSDKKRILFLMNSTFVGGAENALSNIITTEAIEKHVIILKKSNTWIQNKIEEYANYFYCLENYDINKIIYYCKLYDIDLIVFNNFNYDLKMLLVPKIKNYIEEIKIIDIICDNWYWNSLEKAAKIISGNVDDYLHKIDHFICKNKNMRNQFYKKNFYNITVIYNGVDNNHHFSYLANKNNKEFTAITVSRISQEKRLEILFEAAKKLPQIKFIIIGGPSGAVREEYYNQLKEESLLLKNLQMVGELSKPEVLQKLTEADIFVFTSKEEGCPNVLLEAMSVGLPIVAMQAIGVEEIVEENIGCLAETLEDFIQILCDLQQDSINLQQKSIYSQQMARTKYSIEKMINNYMAVFEKVLIEKNILQSSKSSLQVCILVPSLGIGGAEKIALEQTAYLNGNGLKCDLWYFNDYCSEFEPQKSLQYFIHKTQGKPKGLIENTDYDLYISHIIPVNELLGFENKKIINTIHSPAFWGRSNQHIEQVAKDTDLIYHCLSNFTYSMLAPYIYNNKFFILPHGVKEVVNINKEEAKRRLGLNIEDFVIASIGKNSKVKNVHKLLNIFEELIMQEPAKLILIGNMEINIDNGNYELDIMKRIENNSNILYLGVIQENIQNYLMAADCYINTSWSEGLPISIFEALSVGIPCFSHDVGAISEVINEENGFLLNVYSSETEFVNLIIQLKQGSISYQGIRNFFDFNYYLDRYYNIIKDCINEEL